MFNFCKYFKFIPKFSKTLFYFHFSTILVRVRVECQGSTSVDYDTNTNMNLLTYLQTCFEKYESHPRPHWAIQQNILIRYFIIMQIYMSSWRHTCRIMRANERVSHLELLHPGRLLVLNCTAAHCHSCFVKSISIFHI